MSNSFQIVTLCTVAIFSIQEVFTQKWRFQRYRYDPWTGRTTSVEEFDEDVQNMDQRQLTRYMNELRRVKHGLEQMRRESEVLERELGFQMGGFPSLMDNSEKIVDHALNSVTDTLQRRIGHHESVKELETQRKFDENTRTADRQTLLTNLDRLQQTKREISETKNRVEALKKDLGIELEEFPKAVEHTENLINRRIEVINKRLNQPDHAATYPQSYMNQTNIDNTVKKVENAVQAADKRRLNEIGEEFKKMKRFMDTVKGELKTFHNDIGFEFDGIFEPFKFAENILNHGLESINKKLVGADSDSNYKTQQGSYTGSQQYSQHSPQYTRSGQTGRYNV